MKQDWVYIEELRRHVGEIVRLKGWLYNKRASKRVLFLILRDGTGLLQCVVTKDEVPPATWEAAEALTQESSFEVVGEVRRDERQIGGVELHVRELIPLHIAEPYPITPKPHGIEFLLDHRHLWLRSRRPWAIMRVRNALYQAINTFFQDRGFLKLDAPILTANAVEGTSTLFETDFFGEPAYLTQSGQLHAEAMALAFGRVYTFGPTFRAEKSKTRRHLAEFWMIEPEMAFYDLDMNMDLAEELIVYIVRYALEHCRNELEVLGRNLEPLERVQTPFPRISYSEAVDLLHSDETARLIDARMERLKEEEIALKQELEENRKRYPQVKKSEKRRIDARNIEIQVRLDEIEKELGYLPSWKESARNFEWGNDFGGSDETVLTWHFDRPIIVHRYPAVVKAFYMKRDPEDDRLALAMDLLAPEGYGEIIGGGQRADDLTFLKEQIAKHGLPEEVFDWYLDLRKYGSVPHSGFGLGFERTIAWICGIRHVREVIPFPRMMGRLRP